MVSDKIRRIWWDLIRSDGVWWDLMGSDGIWWDLMGFDGIWWDLICWDLIWSDGIWWDWLWSDGMIKNKLDFFSKCSSHNFSSNCDPFLPSIALYWSFPLLYHEKDFFLKYTWIIFCFYLYYSCPFSYLTKVSSRMLCVT